jgi:hypothetical protein
VVRDRQVSPRCGQRVICHEKFPEGCPNTMSRRCETCRVALCENHTHRAHLTVYCVDDCPACAEGGSRYHDMREPMDRRHDHQWDGTAPQRVDNANGGLMAFEVACREATCPVKGRIILDIIDWVTENTGRVTWPK